MAARAAHDRSGLALPALSPDHALLAARIPLPPKPFVVFAVYRPALSADPSPYDSIELARRALLNSSGPLLNSILSAVQTAKVPLLYLFLVADQEELNVAQERLLHFNFDHFTLDEHSSFQLQDLTRGSLDYPLAYVYSLFLDAVRSRAVADVVDTANSSDLTPLCHVRRFKDGFIIHRAPAISDWAIGWEHKLLHRPVVYFYVQIQLAYTAGESPSHLLIHPSPLPTPFSNLPLSNSLPPGSPIVLLPYGTPAYFLAYYRGPCNALSKLFAESLQGLGAGRWASDEQSEADVGEDSNTAPRFIIGWIRVENKQGEDKGTPFIWPTRLCLSYLPSHHIPALSPLPELPAPLQASPQISVPSASTFSDDPLPWSMDGSLPSPSLGTAFHNLTASKSKGINQIADEVGSYVDVVARDRERERERLKKERESGASPKLARKPAPGNVHLSSEPVPTGSSVPEPSIPATAQQALADQVFYPSPPQTTQPAPAPETEKPAPFANRQETPTATFTPPPSTPAQNADAVQRPFDPFSNNSNWAQQSDSYLNLDMDFNMDVDLNFNVNMNTSNVETSNNYASHSNTLDFEEFTEDDFSFFDQPSKSSQQLPVVPLTPVHDFLLPNTTPNKPPASVSTMGSVRQLDDPHLSGPGPPSALQTPWTPGDLFTPKSTADVADSHPPDLIPSSPGPSPEPASAPRTPTVQLDFDFGVKHKTPGDHSSSLFDPIPFAPYHRAIDSKYSSGKFAMIAPADVRELSRSPLFSDEDQSWRKHYNSATDPRPGVVRQLIGVKLKLAGFDQDKSTLSWLQRPHDDWANDPSDSEAMDVDMQSDADSDEDIQIESDTESPIFSRPATPPPPYLPPGASLLHHKFEHSQLLPISTPSRPPGSSPRPSSNPMPSVPTPVSPAAMAGAISEKSKSLREAAIALAMESVENPLWAETWQATSNVPRPRFHTIWPDDLKSGANLLERSPSMEGPLDLARLYDLDSTSKPLQVLDQPHISIAKGRAIIQVLPSALHFWDKLGLGPKGGGKNIDVYAVYEESDDHKRALVDSWLGTVGNTYEMKHLGRSMRGTNTSARNGLVAVRFDVNFRKTLISLISSLHETEEPVVIFLMIPVSIMSLSSGTLRQVLSSMKKAVIGVSSQILFHLVPETCILDVEESPRRQGIVDLLCYSVYDRTLRKVSRDVAERRYMPSHLRQLFQEFAFTLSRPLANKVTYSRSIRASLDVLDRFTLLHISYKISPCDKWLLACCVDQRGESYELGVWFIPSQEDGEGETHASDTAFVVQKILGFALRIAKKTDIEWRIVICKLGLLSSAELEVWRERINSHLESTEFPMHIFLVSAEYDAPWKLIDLKANSVNSPSKNPRLSSAANKHNIIYADTSSVVYAIQPVSRLSMACPPPSSMFSIYQIPEPPPSSQEQSASETTSRHHEGQALPHPLPSLPLATTVLVLAPCSACDNPISMLHIHLLQSFHTDSATLSVPDNTTTHLDITHNYFELAILASARHLSANPILPFHLAALESMWNSLDVDWEPLESTHDN